ncbi:MAG: hypothetical protein LBC90_03200, partial [Candidatus Adiutrix sp.]|nr:hypothetical protein [Candidatus Adiutrix sp.]
MTGDRPDLILPWLFLELGRLAASGGVGAELEAEARSAADRLEAGFPGLSRALKPHLAELAAGYPQPAATLAALKKIIACLERGLEADLSKSEGGGSKGKDGSSHEANRAGEAGEEADNGEGAGGGRPQRPVENILTPVDLAEARRLSLLLQSRLQGLLRTLSVKVNHPGHRGRLDPGSLYKLPIGGSKVFRRSGARVNLDTAVYILLDASGSMAGRPIRLAGLAAYSLAEAC